MTKPDKQAVAAQFSQLKSTEEVISKRSVKLEPKSLTPITSANSAHVALIDHAFYIDFTYLDPAHALGLVDTDEPLRQIIVSRVSIGPDAALNLIQELTAGLADMGVKITLAAGGDLIVNNDPKFGPVNK